MKIRITPPRKPTLAISAITATLGIAFLVSGLPVFGAVFSIAGYVILAAGNLRPGL